MKKGDTVKITKHNGIYNNMIGTVKDITTVDGIELALVEGEGLAGAIRMPQKIPLPNSRYIKVDDLVYTSLEVGTTEVQ